LDTQTIRMRNRLTVLVIALFAALLNILLLVYLENRIHRTQKEACLTFLDEYENQSLPAARIPGLTSPNATAVVVPPVGVSVVAEEAGGVVLSFEEDGRFGNLLLETASLILVARRAGYSPQLLPQVASKLEQYFSKLPLPVIDNSKHCVCTHCTDCLCSTCNKWHKIPARSFHNGTNLNSKYVLLHWFESNIVLQNIQEMAYLYRSLLKQDLINEAWDFLKRTKTNEHLEKDSIDSAHEKDKVNIKSDNDVDSDNVVRVGVHVRRTDYINWVQNKYQGTIVDEKFFKFCMKHFRDKYGAGVRFYVTSDDLPWCREHLANQDVVFPQFSQTQPNSPIQDFVLLCEMDHLIYDYGSFGFWAAVLAGGETLVADNYSSKLHPLLAAIRRHPPARWSRVDAANLKLIN